jgi:chromosome segregation ATPase
MYGNQPPPHFEQLREESERLRAESVRTRMMSVNVYLSIVEQQINGQWIDKAREGMEKVRHRIAEIDRHLREPGYVSSTALDELQEMAGELQERMRQIEKSMGPAL